MVRTRGGSHYRPRVRFSTQEMDDPDTTGAACAHSLDLPVVEQPAVAPVSVLEKPQGFRRYQTRMGPRYPRDDVGGPDPPSGLGHQAWGSPRHLGLNHSLPQWRRAHRPVYCRPQGLGGHCSLGPRFRGM